MKRTILIIMLALAIYATVLWAGDGVASQGFVPLFFSRAITFASPLLYPSWLAAGVLSRDGFPGLAVVSTENTAPLAYALGKGNGRFGTWRNNDNVGYSPGFVLLTDLDGDGNLDRK